MKPSSLYPHAGNGAIDRSIEILSLQKEFEFWHQPLLNKVHPADKFKIHLLRILIAQTSDGVLRVGWSLLSPAVGLPQRDWPLFLIRMRKRKEALVIADEVLQTVTLHPNLMPALHSAVVTPNQAQPLVVRIGRAYSDNPASIRKREIRNAQKRKPSDEPERVRERVQRFREKQKNGEGE